MNRLHKAYQSGKLQPCLLSYYLWSTTALREHLRDGLQDEDYKPPQLRLFTRLAKFPHHIDLSNDRGFARFAQFYPHMNYQHSPAFLNKRPQFYFEEMAIDTEIKKLRYTPEVVFARIQTMKILQGKLRYSDLSTCDYILSWACARANQMQPLVNPPNWEFYLSTLPQQHA
jgi:hypothetical protein